MYQNGEKHVGGDNYDGGLGDMEEVEKTKLEGK